MIEYNRSIREVVGKSHVIVFATNGSLKKDGSNVMGKGLGHVLAGMIPTLPKVYGKQIKLDGNHCHAVKFMSYIFVSMPVKNNWWDKVDIELCKRSATELRILLKDYENEQIALEYPHEDGAFINNELLQILDNIGGNICVYLK